MYQMVVIFLLPMQNATLLAFTASLPNQGGTGSGVNRLILTVVGLILFYLVGTERAKIAKRQGLPPCLYLSLPLVIMGVTP